VRENRRAELSKSRKVRGVGRYVRAVGICIGNGYCASLSSLRLSVAPAVNQTSIGKCIREVALAFSYCSCYSTYIYA
jgi:hypothetical protein